jgi:hypothetical protein
MKSRTMIINLPLTDLEFNAPARTGANPQTNPGIRFLFRTTLSEAELAPLRYYRTHDGFMQLPGGVIPRDQARRLRDFLNLFLDETPDPEGKR